MTDGDHGSGIDWKYDHDPFHVYSIAIGGEIFLVNLLMII